MAISTKDHICKEETVGMACSESWRKGSLLTCPFNPATQSIATTPKQFAVYVGHKTRNTRWTKHMHIQTKSEKRI